VNLLKRWNSTSSRDKSEDRDWQDKQKAQKEKELLETQINQLKRDNQRQTSEKQA
jgi:hypothetical protein